MDAIARFTAYDGLAIVLAIGMFGTIAALQASALQEWRRVGAVGLILMSGVFGILLLLVDPGESVIFGMMEVAESTKASKAPAESLSQQMVREDGKKPGTDASGPGDGDGGKRDGEAERQQAEKAEKAERDGAAGGQGGGAKTANADKKKKDGAASDKAGARDKADADSGSQNGDDAAGDGGATADAQGDAGSGGGSGDGQGAGAGTKSATASDAEKKNKPIADCEKCPVLVRVGSGSFQVGSKGEERGHRNHEGPVRRITIERAFLIGKYEVTREQFAYFLEQSKHPQPQGCVVDGKFAKDRGFEKPGYQQEPNHPAVCVSWYNAKAYVTWLSRLTGQAYRLPSEAEWEFAARAGGRGNFPWGESIRPDDANFNTMKAGTLPVGKFEPNRIGLFDIAGNVWELVEDCWTPNHVEMPANGAAVKLPGCLQRTMRGGAWYNGPRYVRSASRWSNPASAAGNGVGFRVARDLRAQTADAE